MSKHEPFSYEWQLDEVRKGWQAIGWIFIVFLPFWLLWQALRLAAHLVPAEATFARWIIAGVLVMASGFTGIFGETGAFILLGIGSVIVMVPFVGKQFGGF